VFGPTFVFHFCLLWPCVDLLGLFVTGPKALIRSVLGGEMGGSMRESRVHGSAGWCGSILTNRDAPSSGARMGSSYVPLGVAREYMCCGGVRG